MSEIGFLIGVQGLIAAFKSEFDSKWASPDSNSRPLFPSLPVSTDPSLLSHPTTVFRPSESRTSILLFAGDLFSWTHGGGDTHKSSPAAAARTKRGNSLVTSIRR